MSAVGITASRDGLMPPQEEQLTRVLTYLRVTCHEFHHGDCVGGDATGHALAVRLGYTTIAHPPLNPKLRAWTVNDVVYPMKDYLERNREIAHMAHAVIGCPAHSEHVSPRSGTWYTIRFARTLGRHVVVIHPDGLLEVSGS